MSNQKEKARQDKKLTPKALIIPIACGLAAASLLIFLIFGEHFIAAARLSSAKNEVKDADLLLLADPRFSEGMDYTARELFLEGEDAENVRTLVIKLMDRADFLETLPTQMGSWEMNVTFSSEDGFTVIYFLKDSFYIEKDSQKTVFEPDKNMTEEYSELYESLYKRLEELR